MWWSMVRRAARSWGLRRALGVEAPAVSTDPIVVELADVVCHNNLGMVAGDRHGFRSYGDAESVGWKLPSPRALIDVIMSPESMIGYLSMVAREDPAVGSCPGI
jgi:hypothetical protein